MISSNHLKNLFQSKIDNKPYAATIKEEIRCIGYKIVRCWIELYNASMAQAIVFRKATGFDMIGSEDKNVHKFKVYEYKEEIN